MIQTKDPSAAKAETWTNTPPHSPVFYKLKANFQSNLQLYDCFVPSLLALIAENIDCIFK